MDAEGGVHDRPGHRLSRGKYGRYVFSCRLNVMVDSASGIILDARASAAHRAEEPIAAYRMIDRVRERHSVLPRMLAADTGYGSGHFLTWLEDRGIEAHMPLMASRTGSVTVPDREAPAEGRLRLRPRDRHIHRPVGSNPASNGLQAGASEGRRPHRPGVLPPVPAHVRGLPDPARRRAGGAPHRAAVDPRSRPRTRADTSGQGGLRRLPQLRRRVERAFACDPGTTTTCTASDCEDCAAPTSGSSPPSPPETSSG